MATILLIDDEEPLEEVLQASEDALSFAGSETAA